MAGQGDIVFTIGADVTGLTSAGQSGARSLADLEKAAKALDRQIAKIGESGVAYQRQMDAIIGVQREVARSARDSADAFTAFDRSRQAVDALRASIDPLFAASKRYESALAQLDSALEMGTLSAREHAAMVDQLAATYLRADAAADMAATSGRGIGAMMTQNKGAIQGFSYQIQDVAVQLAGGANAATVFAQQGSQVASAFGPWGAAAGAAIAIIAPLAGILLSNADAAEEFNAKAKAQTEILEGLRAATEQLRLERQMGESGAQSENEQKALNRINELMRERESLQKQINNALSQEQVVASQGRSAAMARYLTQQREALQLQLDQNEAELRALNYERAKTIAIELSNTAAAKMQALMRTLSNTSISSPWQAVLGWIRQAEQGARQYNSQLAYAAELANTGQSSGPDSARSKVQFGGGAFAAPVMGAGLASPPALGGGGGGGSDPMQGRIDALLESLKTESEIVQEWYDQSLVSLQAASDAQLDAIGGRHSAVERLEAEHQERLAGIREQGNQWGVDAVLDGGAQILGAMGAFNDKATKLQSVFAAASALRSTYVGAAKEMEKGVLGFGTAAAVIARGLGFVAAIKNASGGGRGGSAAVASGGSAGSSAGAVATTGGSPAAPLDVRLSGIGANDLFSGRQLETLLDRLSSAAGDRGYRLMVSR